MSLGATPKREDPDRNPNVPDPEGVLDLNAEEAEEVDLQALADEAAHAAEVAPVKSDLDVEAQDISEDPRKDLDSAMAQTEAEMAELAKREAELMEQHRRLAADFNNFRNRAQRDIQLAVDQSERRVLLELLPVLDNFERSLESSYQDVEAFRNGVELIRKQFQDALRRLGVVLIPLEVGQPFDALHAEALTTFSTPQLPDGSIAAIFESGYLLRNQLLRPARVVVNNLPSPGFSPPDSGSELDKPREIQ